MGGLFESVGLFNLEKTMVSVLLKELEITTWKSSSTRRMETYAAEDQNQIQISPHEVLQS